MIIPLPTYTEPEEPNTTEEMSGLTRRSWEWHQWYKNCDDWKCPVCSSVMFGRMKYCVYCKLVKGRDTSRPTWYVENMWEGE